jgi:hypothetical protein
MVAITIGNIDHREIDEKRRVFASAHVFPI